MLRIEELTTEQSYLQTFFYPYNRSYVSMSVYDIFFVYPSGIVNVGETKELPFVVARVTV